MKYIIAPSILAANFSCLGQDIRAAVQAGAEYIHVDVMDGKFVPNITIGPLVVDSIKPLTVELGVKLDVHLMIEKPEDMIPAFLQAGADIITVHVETCVHLHRTLQIIREGGASPAVTLNPATPLILLEEVLPDVSQVLLMAVNPGFGGQKFIPATLDRIVRLRKMLDEQGLERVDIEVDGGINIKTIADAARAGANILVAGTAIFNNNASISDNIMSLRDAISAG